MVTVWLVNGLDEEITAHATEESAYAYVGRWATEQRQIPHEALVRPVHLLGKPEAPPSPAPAAPSRPQVAGRPGWLTGTVESYSCDLTMHGEYLGSVSASNHTVTDDQRLADYIAALINADGRL